MKSSSTVPEPHHGELEEAGHRRRQDVGPSALPFGVDEKGARSQLVEDLLGLGRLHPPGPRRPLGGERPERRLGHKRGFLLAHQDLEDLVEELGGRGALREPVEPPDELLVA
jgi:hypothetical protein